MELWVDLKVPCGVLDLQKHYGVREYKKTPPDPSYLWVSALQADSKTLENRVEREGEEEHEGTKGGVSLKVNMDMVAAALQVRACSMSVSVPVAVSVVMHEGRPLFTSSSDLSTVQDNPLHYEDHEKASSHDELRKGETDLLETNTDRFISLQARSNKVKN